MIENYQDSKAWFLVTFLATTIINPTSVSAQDEFEARRLAPEKAIYYNGFSIEGISRNEIVYIYALTHTVPDMENNFSISYAARLQSGDDVKWTTSQDCPHLILTIQSLIDFQPPSLIVAGMTSQRSTPDSSSKNSGPDADTYSIWGLSRQESGEFAHTTVRSGVGRIADIVNFGFDGLKSCWK